MTMVLGIETATPRLSVALGDASGIVASLSIDGERRHVEELAPLVRRLSELARVALTDVDLLAVDVGPGLFTGMRVGIATAQGLAVALGLDVVPVRSCDVLAHPLRHAGRPVVVAVDARRGEVFRSVHRAGRTDVDVTCTAPEAVAAEIALLGPCLAVGDGALRYREVLEAEGEVEILPTRPSADAVVELALRAPAALDPALLEALYLRDADAIPNFEVAR
jgi:tRNA threonylcarbamoyladenosine biosynthesis protein TsaB